MLRKDTVDYYIESLVEHALETRLTQTELLGAIERRYIENLLDLRGRNQVVTARELGVHRNTLARRLKALNISLTTKRGVPRKKRARAA